MRSRIDWNGQWDRGHEAGEDHLRQGALARVEDEGQAAAEKDQDGAAAPVLL